MTKYFHGEQIFFEEKNLKIFLAQRKKYYFKCYYRLKPGTPSYQMLPSICCTLGCATKDFCLHLMASLSLSRVWCVPGLHTVTCTHCTVLYCSVYYNVMHCTVLYCTRPHLGRVVEHDLQLVRGPGVVQQRGRETLATWN